MVTSRGIVRGNRSGRLNVGCLLSVVVLIAGVYYGIGIGKVYLRYWQMLDEMRTQARQAPGLEDIVIRRRLLQRSEELGLPKEADKFSLKRRARPREILITTSWADTLRFPPFGVLPVAMRPEARAPL